MAAPELTPHHSPDIFLRAYHEPGTGHTEKSIPAPLPQTLSLSGEVGGHLYTGDGHSMWCIRSGQHKGEGDQLSLGRPVRTSLSSDNRKVDKKEERRGGRAQIPRGLYGTEEFPFRFRKDQPRETKCLSQVHTDAVGQRGPDP